MTVRPGRTLRLVAGALAIVVAVLAVVGPQPASACTGSPRFDARVWACGIQIEEGLSRIEWNRGRVDLREALTPERILPTRVSPGIGTEDDGPTALQIWVERRPGTWEGWVRGRPSGLTVLEPGVTYVFVADRDLSWSVPRPRPGTSSPGATPGGVPTVTASVFADAQVVALYGHPGVPAMGALGRYPVSGVADEAARVAAEYDALNGDRRVVPALHLIASVAQASPGDGTYLGRMSLDTVDAYVRVTEERGQLLFLDIQIGWGDPLAEVQRYEQQLRRGHVHVALDPEFATRAKGTAPGRAIGSVSAAQIRAVQDYLAGLVRRHRLPPKVLVVHQFRDDMIDDPRNITFVDGVDLVIDMDGFGPQGTKLAGYRRFANSAYSEYAGFKLFYEWDTPIFTPAEIQALDPPPDYVIYQ